MSLLSKPSSAPNYFHRAFPTRLFADVPVGNCPFPCDVEHLGSGGEVGVGFALFSNASDGGQIRAAATAD